MHTLYKGLIILLFLFALSLLPTRAFAADPCVNPINPIVAENCQPGTPQSVWDISDTNGDLGKAGYSNIQGFATNFSINKGDLEQFKIKTDATAYHIDIYRIGYYQGNGARKITTIFPSVPLPQSQPSCNVDASIGLVDCGSWSVSASWQTPATLTSGVYIGKLIRDDGIPGQSHIYFIVRDDAGTSDLLFKTSDTTWQAYNDYGGASLYVDNKFNLPDKRAYKVSYNRPFNDRSNSDGFGVRSFFFNAEYPMIRWLEENGYDVSYFTSVDTAQRGNLLLQHKVFLSVGQDEYWSNEMRTSVENARSAGINLAFFSGNEMFWKTRWENSIDGSNSAFKTLVTYKETHDNAIIDPMDPPIWTGTWRDARFSPPADGGRPENAVSGTIFTVNGPTYNALEVPYAFSKLRFWRNTSVAQLLPGQTAILATVLGHEWDTDEDNGFRPGGLIDLSSSPYTFNAKVVLQDNGSTYDVGTATHALTFYHYPKGGFVFGAGTVQWSWGLDTTHDADSYAPIVPTDPAIQQATVNLLADMSSQPATVQSGLVLASASDDTTPPTSTITSLHAGATVTQQQGVVLSGIASDSGGVVGGVEVSTDNGTSWHPAVGRESWSYNWIPQVTGQVTILSRATDDSGNTETPTSSVTVTVTCPCSTLNTLPVLGELSHNGGGSVEIGTKFRPSINGYITGIKFYKGSGNTGTHVGNIWSDSGTLLASAIFTSESASGWQDVEFANPVPVSANTTYIASYYSPTGIFTWSHGFFTNKSITTGPLQLPADGLFGGNGVYRYGSTSVFPNQTYQGSNYWVDVDFNSNPCPCSIWSTTVVPQSDSHDGGSSVEVGTKFRSAVNGNVTGIRFYKGALNTGVHTGSLWSSTGQLLAQVVFTHETSSGWQTMSFPTPVAISAGKTYIVSYHTSRYFAWDNQYFTNRSVTGGFLTALADGTDGGNGVYMYSTSSVFPTNTYQGSNYWVDVIFTQ